MFGSVSACFPMGSGGCLVLAGALAFLHQSCVSVIACLSAVEAVVYSDFFLSSEALEVVGDDGFRV